MFSYGFCLRFCFTARPDPSAQRLGSSLWSRSWRSSAARRPARPAPPPRRGPSAEATRGQGSQGWKGMESPEIHGIFPGMCIIHIYLSLSIYLKKLILIYIYIQIFICLCIFWSMPIDYKYVHILISRLELCVYILSCGWSVDYTLAEWDAHPSWGRLGYHTLW